MQVLITVLLFLASLFLILLILIQRGRGGGLAGAFGGAGGQSAFGTKAGDVFTRITIGAAAIWILLCIAAVKVQVRSSRFALDSSSGQQAPATTGRGSATTKPASTPADAASGDTTSGSTSSSSDATPGAAPPGDSAPAGTGSSAPAGTGSSEAPAPDAAGQ